MEKIKVCHIITRLELGGAQQNTLFTVAHLDRSRFLPVLVAGSGGILDPEAEKLPGVAVYFIKSLVRQVRPFKDLVSLLRLYALLRREKPAIVHTHSSKAGIIGRWAAWLAGVPVIVHTFHGYGFHDFQRKPVKALYVWIERLTGRITDRFIAVAKGDIDKGVSHGIGTRAKYLLIRSGIDTTYYKGISLDRAEKRRSLGITPAAKVVMTVGPFKQQKNLKDFLRAAKAVKEKVAECRFLVVGDGELRPELEALIAELHLGDAVQLPGWRRDVGELLAASDVFCLTSLWEGLPRSILEAMCTGLAVVANAVDGTREIVQDGVSGYLVTPYDTARMADLIVRLLGKPDLARQMGQKGKELIDRQYDIHYMVEQQEQLYSALWNSNMKIAK
jgi:glycosyltransferase involved in cell wall biosynthesis